MGDIYGSSSALSLASTAQSAMQAPVAAAIVGGVVITGAVVAIGYEEWRGYKEKQHQEEIEEINALHKEFLSKIVVPGYNDIQGFPEIFKITKGEKATTVNSLHYSDDDVRAIGNKLPHGSDVALSTYRESVLSAILKIREYYFSRDDHDDITAGVLSYLINMLDTKCLNFQGYDYDIAYLDAIAKFINEYSSMKGRVNSQHFTRLQPVYSYLLEAKQSLEAHKASLSLEELIAELRDSCANSSAGLIRKLVKMVVPNEQIDLADTVAIEELSRDVLRRRYVKKQFHGLELEHDDEINLPDSVFRDWIIKLSDYYMKSLNPIGHLVDNNTMGPEAMLHYIKEARSLALLKDHVHKKELQEFNKKLEQIRKVFHKSRNFVTTKMVKHNKKSEFVPVTDQNELLDRTEVISDFAYLTHSVISLQYLCTHLLKSVKQLGDLYARDPHHCREIFAVLGNLCEAIKNLVTKANDDFTKISISNENTMRLAKEELFSSEVIAILNTIQRTVDKLGGDITVYRSKYSKTKPDTVNTVIYEMQTVAALIAKMYPHQDAPLTPEGKLANAVQKIIHIKKPEEKVEHVPSEEVVELPANRSMEPSPLPGSIVTVITDEQKVQNLRDVTAALLRKITAMQKEKPDDPQMANYRAIYQSLNSMKIKAVALLQEKDKDDERWEKAYKTSALTQTLCNKFMNFLSLDENARKEQSAGFVEDIHDELSDQDASDFIDKHHSKVSEFFYTYLGTFGLFRTDTRNKLIDVEIACNKLVVNGV